MLLARLDTGVSATCSGEVTTLSMLPWADFDILNARTTPVEGPGPTLVARDLPVRCKRAATT